MKEVAITIIMDSLHKALHERATANWYPMAWEKQLFHPNAIGTHPVDFENMLWLLSDESYPWFVVAEVNQDLVSWHLKRTEAFRRLRNVALSGRKIGVAYRKYLENECGISEDV